MIRNAYELMLDRGQVALSARRMREQVEVDVTDIGCGIPVAGLLQILEPFRST